MRGEVGWDVLGTGGRLGDRAAFGNCRGAGGCLCGCRVGEKYVGSWLGVAWVQLGGKWGQGVTGERRGARGGDAGRGAGREGGELQRRVCLGTDREIEEVRAGSAAGRGKVSVSAADGGQA